MQIWLNVITLSTTCFWAASCVNFASHQAGHHRRLGTSRDAGFRYHGHVGENGAMRVTDYISRVDVPNGVDVLWTWDGGVYTRHPSTPHGSQDVDNMKNTTLSNKSVDSSSNEAELGPRIAHLQIYGDNGLDDRKIVTDTTREPWRWLGFVEPAGCTGTMIGPRHVLTSAHCVYSRDKIQFDQHIRFIPALWGEQYPFGWSSASHILVKSCFLESGDRECDFAVIVLNDPVGLKTGWFGIGVDCDARTVALYTAGYPADKPNGTMWWESCGKFETACGGDLGLLRHDCDMTDGMSGAPLWDEALNIRAIHRGYVLGRNIAVYITPFVLDNLVSWTTFSFVANGHLNLG